MDATTAFYDAIADGYDARVRAEALERFSIELPGILGAAWPQRAGWSCLDVACGTGAFGVYAGFRSYAGVDGAPAMLRRAAGRGYAPVMQGVVPSALSMIADRSYDCGALVSAAYFLSPADLRRVAAELERICRCGWIMTLDGVQGAAARTYEEFGMPVWDHRGCPFDVPVTRHDVPRAWWATEPDGEWVGAEVIIRKITNEVG